MSAITVDAYTQIEEGIRSDRLEILALDADASSDLDGDEYVRIFTALADVGGTRGLLQQVGPLISNLAPGYLDDFAALCRIADSLHAKREEAITNKALTDFANLDDEGDAYALHLERAA